VQRGMGGHSPSNIAHYLKGIDFPASKQDLIDYAVDNNAPDELIEVLQDMPDQQYQSMTDLMLSVAQVE